MLINNVPLIFLQENNNNGETIEILDIQVIKAVKKLNTLIKIS